MKNTQNKFCGCYMDMTTTTVEQTNSILTFRWLHAIEQLARCATESKCQHPTLSCPYGIRGNNPFTDVLRILVGFIKVQLVVLHLRPPLGRKLADANCCAIPVMVRSRSGWMRLSLEGTVWHRTRPLALKPTFENK